MGYLSFLEKIQTQPQKLPRISWKYKRRIADIDNLIPVVSSEFQVTCAPLIVMIQQVMSDGIEWLKQGKAQRVQRTFQKKT